jgi:DNA-binding GntR family transcriptional regulator
MNDRVGEDGAQTASGSHQIKRTRLDAHSVEDIFRVRRVPEVPAVLARVDAEAEQLAQLGDAVRALERAVEAGDWGATVDADELLHERHVSMLDSRRLSRFVDVIQTEIRLCMSTSTDRTPAHVCWSPSIGVA